MIVSLCSVQKVPNDGRRGSPLRYTSGIASPTRLSVARG